MQTWQGFNYEIDMNQEPGQRVMLDQIDLTKSYRVTMTICYRNYNNYLKMRYYTLIVTKIIH